ncbi:MAG: formate dehydrogenase [Burkholderiaceae bacterium]|nr:formate dehydrogenase [Burkholderiaceae bacterium]
MSTKKPKASDGNSRRGFLLGAGLASAAGAAVVATRGSPLQAPAPKAKAKLDERGGGGYHVTDHVKRYYRSTLV